MPIPSSSQKIFVSSLDRISGTDSAFEINIKDMQNDDSDVSLDVERLILPISFTNITGYNNSISLGTTQTVSLDIANYTASTFPTQFISKVSTVYPGVSMTYSSSTGSFGILGLLALGTSGLYNSPGSISVGANQPFLGLSPGIHQASITGSISSDQFADLSGPRECRLITSIPLYSTNTFDNNNDVLLSVYPTTGFGTISQ